jgi:ferritin-like metal-binding protein YciE
MADTARDTFIAGLKDAYAMEKQAEDMMESMQNRLEDYPELRSRAGQHAEETRRQVGRLEQCLNDLGESPSSLKNLGTRLAGNVQSMIHGMTSDEVIKDTLAGYAFEHLEIASYRHLIAMAETLGEHRIADRCRQSLQEEQQMAQWIDQHLEETARQFMQRASSQARAAV